MIDTWAMFSKKQDEAWEFRGFTRHEEIASEFEDEADYEGEVRSVLRVEDGIVR